MNYSRVSVNRNLEVSACLQSILKEIGSAVVRHSQFSRVLQLKANSVFVQVVADRGKCLSVLGDRY